jgi:diguanylate cyclase (GGDEF)-like protein
MDLHLPTLFAVCALLLAVSAAVTTFIAMKQRTHRGYWWWACAGWLVVLALLLAGGGVPLPFAAAMGALLALAWPVLVLGGMRRFYSRRSPGVPAMADWSLLGAGALAVVASELLSSSVALKSGVAISAAIALNVYVAALLTRLEVFSVSVGLKSLVTAMLICAAAEATWLVLADAGSGPAIDPGLGLLVVLLGTLVTALLMTHLGLQLNHERTVDNLRGSLRKLRHIADVDPLTRLPNKRHFQELAERALSTIHASTATVVLFDVDRLKNINDVLGHATGDEALRQVGLALRETLRRRDVAGRLGGDDFAALLLKTSVDEAKLAALRVIARLNDRQVAPRIARVTLNTGVAQVMPGETVGEALRRAESALERNRDEARRLISGAPTEAAEPTQPSQLAAVASV